MSHRTEGSEGTAYIDQVGGMWEARWYSRDEGRYFTIARAATREEAAAAARQEGFKSVVISPGLGGRANRHELSRAEGTGTSPRDKVLHGKIVPVIAHTTARGHNKVYDHKVSLVLNGEYKWTLSIDETPGQWYMETLLLGWPKPDEVDVIRVPEELWIDAGQEWVVLNWREVMTAAIKEI